MTDGDWPRGAKRWRFYAALVALVAVAVVFLVGGGPNRIGLVPLCLLTGLSVVLVVYVVVWSDYRKSTLRVAIPMFVLTVIWFLLAFSDLEVEVKIAISVFLSTVVTCGFLASNRKIVRQRERKTRRGSAAIAAVGFSMIGGALLIGLHVLEVDPPPNEPTSSAVGIMPGVRPELDRGFALGLGVDVDSCSEDADAHITLVASGTREYWRDSHGQLEGRNQSFSLAVPSELDVEDWEVGLGKNLTDVTDPLKAEPRYQKFVHWTDGEFADNADDNMTVITGRVRDWARHQLALVVSFDADWLHERGQGSCYLGLPALAGHDTAFAAEYAAGRASQKHPCAGRGPNCLGTTDELTGLTTLYRPEEASVHGNSTVVTPDGGRVLIEESIPAPDTVTGGQLTWTCTRNTQEATSAFSEAAIVQGVASDCSGFIAIAESEADDRRDLALLTTGIAIAVGLGLLIELLMDWVRSEFAFERTETRRKYVRPTSRRRK